MHIWGTRGRWLNSSWWRHQMETFSALLALCAGEFTGPGEFPAQFPAQRPATLSFDVFFDLCLNKRFSKQPWGWWFETPSWSLCCQYNVVKIETNVGLPRCIFINLLASSYTIWWQRTWSTMAQVMACCLMAPTITRTSITLALVESYKH